MNAAGVAGRGPFNSAERAAGVLCVYLNAICLLQLTGDSDTHIYEWLSHVCVCVACVVVVQQQVLAQALEDKLATIY